MIYLTIADFPERSALVRNEAESKDMRRSAAHAIGQSKERGGVALLQGLYESAKDAELRRSIVSAASHSVYEKEQAFAFLLRVAKTDADWEARRTAAYPPPSTTHPPDYSTPRSRGGTSQ